MKKLNDQQKQDFNIGVFLVFLLILLFAMIVGSCETPREIHQRKLNRAKNKIDKIVAKYPELRDLRDTTYTHTDTVIYTNKHYIQDSIFVQGGITIDTVLQVTDLDSIFKVFNDNIELRLDKISGGHVRAAVSVVPHYIYETDTLHTVDTVFKERIITENTEVINTEKSFWWSLWFQIKGWLWFILIILAILIILRIVFKFVG